MKLKSYETKYNIKVSNSVGCDNWVGSEKIGWIIKW